MLGGGDGGGGAGLGLDLSAVIQAAVVGLVLFSAAVVAVRCAASRYFVVDAAGFAASYDDHHHHNPPAYPMLPQGSQELMAQGQAAGGDAPPCAECGSLSTKKCSGCKCVRTSIEDIKERISNTKKDEIGYLTGLLEKVEERNNAMKARIELLKKEEDLNATRIVLEKLTQWNSACHH